MIHTRFKARGKNLTKYFFLNKRAVSQNLKQDVNKINDRNKNIFTVSFFRMSFGGLLGVPLRRIPASKPTSS